MDTKLKVGWHLIKDSRNNKSYGLYINLSGITCLLLVSIIVFFMYVMWPGLQHLSYIGAIIFEIIGVIAILVIVLLWLLLILATVGIKIHPFLLKLSNRFIYALFPVMVNLGFLIKGVTKDTLRQSMINLINHLVLSDVYSISPERILLLTPHCLQKSDCVHKVTHDVYNCKECGGCDVGGLLGLAREYGCQCIVVTGGTLARMKVKIAKPELVIAIACERDLASGMVDVFPIPVIGILNERPNGPCYNTKIQLHNVRDAIEKVIRK